MRTVSLPSKSLAAGHDAEVALQAAQLRRASSSRRSSSMASSTIV